MVHYQIKVNNSFLTQFYQFQIEIAQCFPVKKGLGETVLIGSCCDAVTCDPFFNRKSCAKNLDKVFGMIQDADLPLDLGALFVAWVGKDRQLTNSAVLRVQQHFFVHQVFKTDGS